MKLRRLSPFVRIEDQLEEILRNQRLTTEQETKMAMTLADVDAQLVTADTTIAQLQADTATLIGQKQTQPDATAEVTHLQNINTALSAMLAAEGQAITPVPSPATSGTAAPVAS
jgi:hypothetical protein